MPNTFKFSVEFPEESFKVFAKFIDVSIAVLLKEEEQIRDKLSEPELEPDIKVVLSNYLEQEVIPQLIIVNEVQRAVTEANPTILLNQSYG